MSEQPQVIPEWIATLIGRLVLENESMRQVLTAKPHLVDTQRTEA